MQVARLGINCFVQAFPGSIPGRLTMKFKEFIEKFISYIVIGIILFFLTKGLMSLPKEDMDIIMLILLNASQY